MLENRADQAAGLRRLLARSHLRVIAVAAGCNGVGSTSAVVNLAAALAARGRQVLVIDENFGPHNVAGLLGVRARRDVQHVMDGACELEDALIAAPCGVVVLPAAGGVRTLPRLKHGARERLIESFGRAGDRFDLVLIDAHCGTTGSIASFSGAGQDMVIVCSAAAAAITESYALIKRRRHLHEPCRYHVLLNRVADERTARVIFGNLERVANAHLATALGYLGCVPKDEQLRRATAAFQPVVAAFPAAPSATVFRRGAETVASWPANLERHVRLDGFMQRLFLGSRFTFANAGV